MIHVCMPMCRLVDMSKDVQNSSFIDFWSRYKFDSAGRPSKSGSTKGKTRNQIMEVTKPMIAVPKPAVSMAWSKPGDKNRAWYCECMLKRHKPFISYGAFHNFMEEHRWDFEDAFQTFARSDEAPTHVKDAFSK